MRIDITYHKFSITLISRLFAGHKPWRIRSVWGVTPPCIKTALFASIWLSRCGSTWGLWIHQVISVQITLRDRVQFAIIVDASPHIDGYWYHRELNARRVDAYGVNLRSRNRDSMYGYLELSIPLIDCHKQTSSLRGNNSTYNALLFLSI